ncbi:hypothetical protein [Methylobacterium sp. J-090]|uniref:hypothetical protein n=1 Tax=Methylobacterium sp. J-090 TaxID=2836666 RepID=UPI001FB8C299|nr:hypothetical protein [Methylobacterium sp. J-090]MCJ2080180.1 hypothetical protein [Methylobacterium sp. J-090]
MFEAVKMYSDILSEPRSPIYHIILLADCGKVHNVLRLNADDDEQAIERAKMMVDGHAVELWDGLRLIEHFAPVT